MEYKIKVPLTEFLQNGGKLEIGRPLHCVPSGMGAGNGTVYLGDFIEKSSREDVIFVKNGTWQFPTLVKDALVEIPVTPIYK